MWLYSKSFLDFYSLIFNPKIKLKTKKLIYISLFSLCFGAAKAQTYTDLCDFNYTFGADPHGFSMGS
jgi:hypothetical protein